MDGFEIITKKRGAYAGASKRKYTCKGRSFREYEVEQNGQGWGVDVSNRDYFVMRVIFDKLQDAKLAVGNIENGCFDYSTAKRIVEGNVCFECGGKTPSHERACKHCGTLKPWLPHETKEGKPMDKPKIEIVDDFARIQDHAIETAFNGEMSSYCPSNEDLLNVLEKWEGKICLEFDFDAPTITVEVVKTDFLSEIRRYWALSAVCHLKFSCISHGHGLVVLKAL